METGCSKSDVLFQNRFDHLQRQHPLRVVGQNVTGRLRDGFSNLLRTQRERSNALPKRDIPFPHHLDVIACGQQLSSRLPPDSMLVRPSFQFTPQPVKCRTRSAPNCFVVFGISYDIYYIMMPQTYSGPDKIKNDFHQVKGQRSWETTGRTSKLI